MIERNGGNKRGTKFTIFFFNKKINIKEGMEFKKDSKDIKFGPEKKRNFLEK